MAGAVAGGTMSACSNALAAPMHDGGSSSNSRSGSGSAAAAAVTAAAAAAAAGNAYAFHGWRVRIHQSPWHSHDSCAPGRLQRYFICGRQTEPTEERYSGDRGCVSHAPTFLLVAIVHRYQGGEGRSRVRETRWIAREWRIYSPCRTHVHTDTSRSQQRAEHTRSWSTGSAPGGGCGVRLRARIVPCSVLSHHRCIQNACKGKARTRNGALCVFKPSDTLQRLQT